MTPSTDPNDHAIDLRDVRVRLGNQNVLDGVDLQVRRGEFLAVIGPSGGGKSTLLRVIGGLLRPASGEVRVSSPPAFVFQDYRLLPWRTALRNVQLPHDLGRGNGGLPAREALKLVGMEAYCRYYPSELSGGMRARVALARALAQSGDVLLLDEPFAALDALVRERFNAELKHLHDKTGRTTVLITHSIREAAFLADRVAVLQHGRIIAVRETNGGGRVSAYTDGLEAELRDLLGTGDSTRLVREERPRHAWWWSVLPLVGLALGLLAWHLRADALQNPLLLPRPQAVLVALLRDAPTFLSALWVTARTMIAGALLGGALGVLFGYLLGKFVALERFASPYLVALQSTPIVILAPFLTLWLGFGTVPGIVVSAISALYPMLVAAMIGVRSVPRPDLELFASLHATRAQRLLRLELPHALPVLLGALRLGISLALIGAVVWEFVDPNVRGLGFLVNQAGAYYDSSRKFAAVLLLVLFGVVLYALVTALERWSLRHRPR
ncbi:ATP-binding cassette domain-containing protein [Deinococcus maricopensis]|uniref:Polyamine-transporting ATPase n=1 Tax=Deinococcus maricopensis (strain DSM 21211 / LMG 22137 / NRRL B-23946 / LB-34) TaxID=709986 RepID=E8U5V8_DEIML|nr:ATP-binding cassette domain-containing protein [Deinococcus maricopensis]ADV66447.1 Polyamine-transporting ATPase [Deinococcus maricopensis DSM 21211]